jgi:subtilisin family serine protease
MNLNETQSNTVRSRRSVFLIAATSFALTFTTLGVTPAGANQQNSSSNATSEESEISRLLISYEPGVSPVDANGDVTGQNYVPSVDLEDAERIGKNVFTVDLPSAVSESEAIQISSQLEKSPQVKIVEPDFPISLAVTESVSTQDVSASGLWGLDRIDQSSLPLNNTYTYDQSGLGVDAYVIDSGIKAHNEFGDRLTSGYSAFAGETPNQDCSGHGTHVAGILGGETYGVAKSVRLIPVKVFPCTGDGETTVADVILGVNWVISHHGPGKLAVANMSLGGPKSEHLDLAVMNLIADGVHVIVASGNDTDNACDYSPASTYGTITVNSLSKTDSPSSFSNFGECTDIYAPGENIVSAGIDGASSFIEASGTSMATPFVAGAMAKILQSNPSYTQSQAVARILDDATRFDSRIVDDATRILYSPSALGEIALAEAARVAAVQTAAAEAARVAAAKKRLADQKAAAARLAASPPVVKKSLKVKALKKKRISISVAAPKGSKTVLQRKVGKKWRTVNSKTTVAKTTIKVSKSGKYRVRIKLPTGTVTSKTFRVK